MNVTIFCSSMMGMGVGRCVGKLIRHGAGPRSAFDHGPFVEFLPPKKRKPRLMMGEGYKPYLLIVQGSDIPNPPLPFVTESASPYASGFSSPAGCSPFDLIHRFESNHYLAFDPRYLVAFNKFINAYSAQFLADYRYTRESTDEAEREEFVVRPYSESATNRRDASDNATIASDGVLDLDVPTPLSTLPDDVSPPSELVEGAVRTAIVNAYERDPEVRRQCIAAHGTNCFICGFDFAKVYGHIGEGYIHVHHLCPLSEISGAHSVDPVKDLRPVCPNCHAVIHSRVPALGIDEVRTLLHRAGHAEQGGGHVR